MPCALRACPPFVWIGGRCLFPFHRQCPRSLKFANARTVGVPPFLKSFLQSWGRELIATLIVRYPWTPMSIETQTRHAGRAVMECWRNMYDMYQDSRSSERRASIISLARRFTDRFCGVCWRVSEHRQLTSIEAHDDDCPLARRGLWSSTGSGTHTDLRLENQNRWGSPS